MVLSQTQAEKTISTPHSKKEIESVKSQESQLRVFTEELDANELGSEHYWNELQKKMKARSEKKFDRVFQFARYPLPVAQISDSILSDYFKVFEGKNRNFHIDGDRDLSVLHRWLEEINLEKWIEENAKEVFKNKPCSFVVIDKDSTGKPYPIFIDSNRLIDAKFKNSKGDMEYITFLHSATVEGDIVTKKYAVYDETTYWVFQKSNKEDSFTLVSNFQHGLGYCPAKAFISQPTNDKNLFKRRVAFSNALSKLEDWTIFDIFRNYVDHYAPFPVTEAPKKKCPNPDCDNGMITEEVINDLSNPDAVEIKYHACQACKNGESDHIYPGTHIGIQVKSDKSLNDGSGVFRMIFPETDKMEYVPKKLDELELEIRHKTVGLNYMASTNEAMNQMQLKGSFASMESVLLRTKDELDKLYKWIVKTAGNLYYKNLDIKIDANFGTEFYLITEDDLQKRFDNAKKIGLPKEEQLMIYQQLIETKYKGNPNKVARQKLLLKLDPLPLYDTKEVIELKDKNIIDSETLSLKINFLNFVAKFESENSPITQFGLNLAPEKRIEKIKQEFDIYNKEVMEKIAKEKETTPAPATPPQVV